MELKSNGTEKVMGNKWVIGSNFGSKKTVYKILVKL